MVNHLIVVYHYHTSFAVNFDIKLITEADLQISGYTSKDAKIYTEENKYLDKTYEHTYQVSKFLSSPINGIEIEVCSLNYNNFF